MRNHTCKAHLFQLLICLILGLQYAFIKNLYEHFANASFFVLAIRFLLSAGFLYVLCRVKKKSLTIKTNPRELLAIAFYPALSLFFQFLAVQRITTSMISVVLAFSPLINGAVCVCFPSQKKPLPKQLLFMCLGALCVMGFFLLQQKTGKLDWLGIGLIVASVAARSLCNVFYEEKKHKDAYSFACKQSVFAFLINGVCAVFFTKHISLGDLFARIDFVSLLQLAYLGLLATAAVALLNLDSLKSLDASTIGIYSNLTGVISFLVGVFIGGEQIQFIQVILFVLLLFFAYLYVRMDVKTITVKK